MTTINPNALAVLDQGRPPSIFTARPSALTAAAQANIFLGFPVVTYRGKVWRIVYQGEEEVVSDPYRPDQPAPSLEVVIIGVAEAVSKQFYLKAYVEGSDSGPDCYSMDGIKPDAASPQRQNPLCVTCPQNQWGSRVTEDGRRAKRCADAKRLTIVPAGDIENDAFGGPMLLRVPPTSLANLSMYAGNLARRGAPIEALVTRIGFNVELAYPQLTFTATRWLSDEEAQLVVGADGNGGMRAHPLIPRILVESVAQGAPGASEADPEPEQPQQPPQPQPQPPPPPPPPPVQEPPPPQAAQPAPQAMPPQPPPQVQQPETAPAAPRRRSAAFGGGGAPTGPTLVHSTPAPGPAPNGAAATVSAAPAGMENLINDLLATQVTS